MQVLWPNLLFFCQRQLLLVHQWKPQLKSSRQRAPENVQKLCRVVHLLPILLPNANSNAILYIINCPPLLLPSCSWSWLRCPTFMPMCCELPILDFPAPRAIYCRVSASGFPIFLWPWHKFGDCRPPSVWLWFVEDGGRLDPALQGSNFGYPLPRNQNHNGLHAGWVWSTMGLHPPVPSGEDNRVQERLASQVLSPPGEWPHGRWLLVRLPPQSLPRDVTQNQTLFLPSITSESPPARESYRFQVIGWRLASLMVMWEVEGRHGARRVCCSNLAIKRRKDEGTRRPLR